MELVPSATANGATLVGVTLSGALIFNSTLSGVTIVASTFSGTIGGSTISGSTIIAPVISGGTSVGMTISGATIVGSTISGMVTIATASGVQTGTDATTSVPPAYAQYHNSALKWWVTFQVDGTRLESYNVSSVTDGGGSGGDWTPNFTSALGSMNYGIAGAVPIDTTAGVGTIIGCGSTSGARTTTACRVICMARNGSVADPFAGTSHEIGICGYGTLP